MRGREKRKQAGSEGDVGSDVQKYEKIRLRIEIEREKNEAKRLSTGCFSP